MANWGDNRRPAMTAVLVLALVLGAVGSVSAQIDWDAASRSVRRLSLSVYRELPESVATRLREEGCTVPQAWGDQEPHNVIRGSFAAPGQTDWAVLCSSSGSSSILVVWGGPVRCPIRVAPPEPDRSYLQADVDSVVFSRRIAAVVPDPRYWQLETTRIRSLDHDAIADQFLEKGAVAFYCHDGAWHRIATSD